MWKNAEDARVFAIEGSVNSSRFDKNGKRTDERLR